MRVLIAAVALAAAGSCHAFDLKGIGPGVAVADVDAKYPGLKCADSAASEFGYCTYRNAVYASRRDPSIPELDTLGGAAVLHWNVYSHRGEVGRVVVSLYTANFEHVRGAIVEKYGRPTSVETAPLKTRAGVEYEQSVATWKRDGQVLRVERYSGTVEYMDVTLTGDAYAAADRARRESSEKAGAKDM